MINTLLETKLKLLRLYNVTQLGTCTCPNANCKSPGKHPIGGVYAGRVYHNPVCFDGHNVGVCTGEGLIVMDIDPRNGGDTTLAGLVTAFGKLPETWTVLTGGGGLHYYFKGDCKSFVIEPGIDIQGPGKMVVAPPSRHRSGTTYKWILSPRDVELAEAPEWLINLAPSVDVEKKDSSEFSDSTVLSALKAIGADCNYNEWNKVGLALYNGGYDYAVFNDWSATCAHKYDERECARKWRQYKQAKTISVTPASIVYLAQKRGWTEFDESLLECFR